MEYIEGIVFYCLKQLNGERTIYSIFHLLKGKKSSQTIQDAHFFELTKYFGIYPSFTRESLDAHISRCLKKGLVQEVGENRFILTAQGEADLEQFLGSASSLSYLDGWKYQHTSTLWERLSLLVQVVSNLVAEETDYLPIQKNRDLHLWIKQFLSSKQVTRKELGEQLFAELVHCFEKAEKLNPSVFVYRLTGCHQIGLTPEQTAQQLQIDVSHSRLEFSAALHFLNRELVENASSYLLLAGLLAGSSQDLSLTLSSRRTLSLINEGYSLEEIAKMRGLKKNTIEDHVVEIALNMKQFSIDKYIDKPTQSKILAVANKEETRQLKQIRSEVQTANYFEIRLVLAKYGAGQC